MREEIGILKIKLDSLATIRQEGEELRSAIGILKEEILEIKTTNKERESKILGLEEGLEENSEDDAENDQDLTLPNKHEKLYSCHYCDIHIRTKSNFDAHIKSHVQKESKAASERREALKKHINTKHQYKSEEPCDTSSESKDELDLFQLEVVRDEEVYICTLCDEGFDSESEVKDHLKKTHRKVFEIIEDGNV